MVLHSFVPQNQPVPTKADANSAYIPPPYSLATFPTFTCQKQLLCAPSPSVALQVLFSLAIRIFVFYMPPASCAPRAREAPQTVLDCSRQWKVLESGPKQRPRCGEGRENRRGREDVQGRSREDGKLTLAFVHLLSMYVIAGRG